MNSIIMIAALFVMLLAFMIPAVPTLWKVVICIASLIVIVFTRRGAYYFSKANKAMQSGDKSEIPLALENYKKAIKLGISDNWVVTAGSVLIQQGEYEVGEKALRPIMTKTKSRDPSNALNAKIAISMAYWKTGRLDEAIAVCEEVKSKGSKSKNLHVNLATYYLSKGDVKSFHELMKEISKDDSLRSSAILDLQSVDAILSRGDYREAGEITDDLFGTYKFRFADPYLRRAQVQIHYGKREEAIKSLEEGLEKSLFQAVSVIQEDFLKALLEALKDEEKAPYMEAAMERNPLMMANGILPPLTEESYIPKAEETPRAKTVAPKGDPEKEYVNTELTDEDEAWLRKHT